MSVSRCFEGGGGGGGGAELRKNIVFGPLGQSHLKYICFDVSSIHIIPLPCQIVDALKLMR